jgi:hypothetical protein
VRGAVRGLVRPDAEAADGDGAGAGAGAGSPRAPVPVPVVAPALVPRRVRRDAVDALPQARGPEVLVDVWTVFASETT